MNSTRIHSMPVYQLRENMGPKTGLNEVEALRGIAIKAGWGEAQPSDVPDELWFYWVALAAEEVAS